LDKCVDQLRGLELEAYSGDYALSVLPTPKGALNKGLDNGPFVELDL
jgi:hypothetical protein